MKIEKIKEDIQSLGSKELSFGCKFVACNEVYTYGLLDKHLSIITNTNNLSNFYQRKYLWNGVINLGYIKILGHPPTLNDILLKLGEKGISHSLNNGDRIMIYEDNEEEELFKLQKIDYDLTKSVLDQPEETLRKLHKLLFT